VNDVIHVWHAVWPNLLSSAITFSLASAWHLGLVRRTLERHETALRHHLTAHDPTRTPNTQETTVNPHVTSHDPTSGTP